MKQLFFMEIGKSSWSDKIINRNLKKIFKEVYCSRTSGLTWMIYLLHISFSISLPKSLRSQNSDKTNLPKEKKS